MEAFRITGPTRLSGVVEVSGSKNSTLPLLFSALMFEEPVRFENVPRLWDVETTLHLMESMGAKYDWDKDGGRVTVHPQIFDPTASYEWVRKMRAGVLALAPLLVKCRRAKVSLPGGCAIGARPVDFHLEAMTRMGVDLSVEQGYIIASIPGKLKGAHLIFPKVTVTGTENILMLAAFAEGRTLIENAACEPEVVALGNFLRQQGAEIQGLGTNRIEVVGGKLSGPSHAFTIPKDRIETGTWIAAAACTRSELTIEGCHPSELSLVLELFGKMGVEITTRGSTYHVKTPDALKPIFVETAPFPGFPTDMQAQMIVAMCTAKGDSQMRESVFENRFMHVAELLRMNANIDISGSLAVVHGPCDLKGAPVMATDLRASASLVIAGLCAEGETIVRRIYHLDRGYQRLDQKLKKLGASVERFVDEPG